MFTIITGLNTDDTDLTDDHGQKIFIVGFSFRNILIEHR